MPRSISELESYLKKKIKDITDKEFLEFVAQEARDIIYKRTKSGKGLSATKTFGTSLTPLKKLNSEYIVIRGQKILGPFGTAKKSNLTLSGELLESMVYKITGNSVTLSIDTKTHEGTNITTRELAEYVSKQGRPFFGLAVTEEKILNAFIQRLIRARIKNDR